MTATLQMLLDEGIGLRCWCPKCSRSWVLDATIFAFVAGPDTLVPLAADMIMCEKCGSVSPEVQPDWPSKGPGVIARH